LTAKNFGDINGEVNSGDDTMLPQTLLNDSEINALKPIPSPYKRSIGKSLFIETLKSFLNANPDTKESD
jgi:hypothetical protein